MSEKSAHLDEQQNFSIIGVQGTLGTADVQGTAPTIPIGVDPATGAQYVYNLGPAGSVSLGNITGGTINRIDIIGTMPAISIGNASGGTLDLIHTVGTISNLAGGSVVVTNGTTTISGTVPISGTVTSTPGNSSGGTLDLVKTVGTVSNIGGGSIVVTAGTVASVGTIPGIGIIGNVNTGSIVVTNGTLASSGTTTGVGVVGNLNGGTLSILTNGSIVTTNGTIGGKGANAAATVGFPVLIGGMDAGGTTYALKVDNSGNQQMDMAAGTLTTGSIVVTAGTIASSGTTTGVGVVGNINGGTISIITNGTLSNSGTTTGVGTVAGVGVIGNINGGTIGILTNGTLTNSGTTTGVGVVGNINGGTLGILTNGSIVVTNGTIAAHAITNLQGGTISIVTDGTLSKVTNVGTVPGVGVVGNLNGGTLGILTNGSLVVTGGTVKNDGRAARNILSFGTTFGGTNAAYGTLVGSATVGAGTSLWVNDVSIVNNSGTLTASVGFGTALNGSNIIAKGNFGAQGGIQKSFPLAVNAGSTNADLTCYISAAGTIDVVVSYFLSA